jgi:molybdopterin-binding protein
MSGRTRLHGVIVGSGDMVGPGGSVSVNDWWRKAAGYLTITSRQFGAPAPPLTSELPYGYGNIGFQASGATFAARHGRPCRNVSGGARAGGDGQDRALPVPLHERLGRPERGIAPTDTPGTNEDKGACADMRLSTRNQLTGTVASVEIGSVMAIVKVTLAGGQTMTASVTKEAVEDLGLREGSPVTVLVKSTEVMLAVE